MQKVSVDGMSEALENAFQKFGKVTTDDVGEAAKYAAKEALQTLRDTTPYKSRTGKYKRSFTAETAYRDTYSYGMRIGARGPYYRLTHLLEKGHRIRGGSGKTRGVGHCHECLHFGKFVHEHLCVLRKSLRQFPDIISAELES